MALNDVINSINKKFKSDILRPGNTLPSVQRVPFSSARLNYLTRGGIPFPGSTELSGAESSGKTTLLGDLTKNAQQMGLLCAFTDTENKTDLDYWKFLGVDIDNLLLCKPMGVSGEDILQLQFELMAEGVTFLGLDSVASLVPNQVLNGTMDDKTYCGSSGILSTFSQKLTGSGILFKNNVCMVGINQVRDKVNTMGFGLKTPGGHFWKHACLCRLQLTKGHPFDSKYKEMALNSVEPAAGHKIDVRLIKNQFSKNDRKLNICTLTYDKGIDVFEDAIDIGITLDIIQRAGAWYRLVNLETGEVLCIDDEELKFQGKANLREYLADNTRIARWVSSQIDRYVTE